jgi:hypothetical protein
MKVLEIPNEVLFAQSLHLNDQFLEVAVTVVTDESGRPC